MNVTTQARRAKPLLRNTDAGWEVEWRCCSHLPAGDPRIASSKFTRGEPGKRAAQLAATDHWSRYHVIR